MKNIPLAFLFSFGAHQLCAARARDIFRGVVHG